MKILWLIPARSGSKSVPHKNIKVLGEFPLMAYRIKAAQKLKLKHDEIWVSTDSQEYAELAESFGAKVPFIRPVDLSTDRANSVDVVFHALDHAKTQFDAVALLEPTSPFVKRQTIQDAINYLVQHDTADGIIAMRQVHPSSIFIQKEAPTLSELSWKLKSLDSQRRQDQIKEITPSGGFYIVRTTSLQKEKRFYTPNTLSYEVDPFEGLEIDSSLDWEWAEFLMSRGKIDLSTII